MNAKLKPPDMAIVLKKDGRFIKDFRLALMDGPGKQAALINIGLKLGAFTRHEVEDGVVQVVKVTVEVAETIAMRI